jgi:hypothetical protein
MAFDQTTRNRLQHFVNDARRVLEEEFTRQLQNDYGMDPKAGTVAELASLRHINDAQRETARILRDTLAHYTASGEMNASQGLDRIVREQAFTVLNRLAALRMAESRGLLVESVGNGFQAKGFQLYTRLAGTGLGETSDAYRVYLFSVFDELAQDLPGLFDRYSPQGRLFPREAALLQVLNLINDVDIAPLWSEDETIGWIYQYFNSLEERKAMRESRAPRTSRELAVRNQFFTPRYVVEFLVDNTLGRLWFNATGGDTHLHDRCQYLLVKPDETPQAATKLRDPRTLKLLDPACGSMHFGLYAFDLFVEIYREAWAWEQRHGPGALDVSTQHHAALKPLSRTYEDEAAFLRDVPRLIIEHNIYGVDIDPRAAQIASLALWLRAQRAWHDAGIKAKDRPLIGHGHVVAAVAPPAERQLRQQFAANLDQRDAELFAETLQLLKGLPELGVLLQVEHELPQLIRQVYVGKGTGLFAQQEQESWQQTEARLREALTEFAQAAKATFQGRLFAQDALQGFRIIDLCQEKFDVIVMNPPFGDSSVSVKSYIDEHYPNSKGNLLANFIERSKSLLGKGGYLGAIVSRTCFYLKSFSSFRKQVLLKNFSLNCFADLGQGVLDAMVETAAATWRKSDENDGRSEFFRHLTSANKSADLLHSISRATAGDPENSTFSVHQSDFLRLDDAPFVYWIGSDIIQKFSSRPSIDPSACDIRVGLQTNDDFRFLRLWYEVNSESIISPKSQGSAAEIRRDCIDQSLKKKWAWYSKTDKSSAFQASIHVLAKWEKNGAEVKAYIESKGHVASKHVMSEDRYFTPGFSYMLRATRLVPYVVPIGVIPTAGRSQIYPANGLEDWVLLLMGSNIATCVARFRGENFTQPKFQNSMVGSVPYFPPKPELLARGLDAISEQRNRVIERLSRDDSEIYFVNPALGNDSSSIYETDSAKETLLGNSLEAAIADEYGLDQSDLDAVTRDLFEALRTKATSVGEDGDEEASDENAEEETTNYWHGLISYAVGCAFGRWDIREAFLGSTNRDYRNPFEPLPTCPVGALTHLERSRIYADGFTDYPLSFTRQGVLPADSSAGKGLLERVHDALDVLNISSDGKGDELSKDLGCTSIQEYLLKQNGYFSNHLKQYSKSRRRAPIYWPLSTATGSYTIWLYYSDLSNQTLYTAINDFIEPKLKQVSDDVTALRNKVSARTRDDENQFESLQSFELELIELRDTLLKLAPTYKPSHDDGVQISAAPLWQLFRHKPWQKVLKDTWAKLEKGEYDWAHLAMNYWPDRVREKCKTDKSLAIAHGLEDLYVELEAQPKKPRGRKKVGDDE